MAEGNTLSRYAVSADGKRFLMAAEPNVSAEAPPLRMTVNWLARVKKWTIQIGPKPDLLRSVE